MLALAQYRVFRCPGCGLDRRESTDAESEGRYRVTERRCHACTALSMSAKKFADNPQSEALLYHVERR